MNENDTKPQPPANLARPEMAEKPTVILGGGPAGLTAGYLLAKKGLPVIVLEAEDQVGGIAKTAVRDGYRFDLGGHRFFTKVKEVDDLWHEIMREEFLKRPRMSRIYWNKKFLDYPLRGPDVVKKLGPVDLTKAFLSYLWAKVKPKGKEETFEQWVVNRFGRWLFNEFFKSYTEKVWGVPTSEIRADWAAQRIKGLSFFSAAKSAFFGNKGDKIKSLISEFNYPRYGPGQMWETMTDDIRRLGGQVLLEHKVTKLDFEGERCVRVHVGDDKVFEPSAVISSLPLRNAVGIASPHPRPEVVAAAKGMRYRDFLTVAVVLNGDDIFPDNWIYIHDPSVNVGRIQNFRSWSPWMVPDRTKACVGLEFFCFAGDELWETPDEKLVELGMRELEELGLARRDQLEFGFVERVPKAYPIYDAEYAERVSTMRTWLDGLDNYIQVGRNGLHRYNNSDHSMLTAMRAVDNLVDGADHDIWAVNAESVYHEEENQDEQQPYIKAPETESMKEPLHS
jgi:protoporphyrinogen oxidase